MGNSFDRREEEVSPTCAAILSVGVPRLPKPNVVHGYPRSKLPDLVGLSRRQIEYLAERGLVIPSVRGASGRGRPSLYGWEDLLVMATLRKVLQLSASELGAKRAATVVEAMRGISQQPIEHHCLVIDTERTFVVDHVRLASKQLEAGTAMTLIPLRSVESDLEGRLLQEGLSGPFAETRQRAA